MGCNDNCRAFLSHAAPNVSLLADVYDGCDSWDARLFVVVYHRGRDGDVSSFSIDFKNSCHCCHFRHNSQFFRSAEMTALPFVPSSPSSMTARDTTTTETKRDFYAVSLY